MSCQKCESTETVDSFRTVGALTWQLCDDCANEYNEYIDDLDDDNLILYKATEMRIENSKEKILLSECIEFYKLDKELRIKYRTIDKAWLDKTENY